MNKSKILLPPQAESTLIGRRTVSIPEERAIALANSGGDTKTQELRPEPLPDEPVGLFEMPETPPQLGG